MRHRSRLTIDLDSITHNYRYLDGLSHRTTRTGAAVKANGYGLGMTEISRNLYHSGCRHFFVASLNEAITLRQHFTEHHISDAEIIVFDGPTEIELADYDAYSLTAVLNCPRQIEMIQRVSEPRLKTIVHIDTGMSRLGIDAKNLDDCIDSLIRLPHLTGVMSHMANSEDAQNPFNREQHIAFCAALNRLTTKMAHDIPASFANTGGILAGTQYHFELTRPGIGLYGITPDDSPVNASGLRPTLRWDADILQMRTIEKGQAVGYGSHFTAQHPMRLATIAAGYADGYPRCLSQQTPSAALVEICGYTAPLVGRISMDVMVVDISHIPEQKVADAQTACLIGPHYSASQLAADTSTIGYEILTGIGERVIRHYDSAHTAIKG